MNSVAAVAVSMDVIGADVVEQPIDVDPVTGLFGMLTRPETACRDTGFIFINAGLLHRVGPFRLYVDIARRLARSGYPSIRLDQSGKGDSDPLPGISLQDANLSNLAAAMTQLERETGARRFVIGGVCSGADDALQAGPWLDDLAGVFLFDGYTPKTVRYYVQRYAPRILSTRSWRRQLFARTRSKSGEQTGIGNMRNWGTRREMMERYHQLVEKGVRVLAVYSGWTGNFYKYPSQLIANVGHARAKDLISEVHFPEATHLLHSSKHRREVVSSLLDWAEASFGASKEQ